MCKDTYDNNYGFSLRAHISTAFKLSFEIDQLTIRLKKSSFLTCKISKQKV